MTAWATNGSPVGAHIHTASTRGAGGYLPRARKGAA
jgi:hypothetical protein